ncbi:hypothetical protein DFH11DRAFT_851846 [Phellopilus nigrolimitatus]|nr:hypothetical protein DFH11DRAFT_851846 [Phellopilus nigrolimitatus]
MQTAAQTFPETQKTKRMRVVSRPYTKNTACSKCKKARSKCEGYPTCERCVRLDHECIRGLDHRKALTRRHEQNLRHQNENLRLQVEEMKTTIDTLVFDLSLLRPQASNGAHIDSIRLANETDSYIRTSSRKGTHQPGPSDLRTSDNDEPNPCSESDSDSSVESDEEHSEPETINADGRRSIFAIQYHT